MRARSCWAAAVVGLLCVVGVWYCYSEPRIDAKRKHALSEARQFILSCKRFRSQPQGNGKFPTRLEELVTQRGQTSAVLDGGLSMLIDPWGRWYQYTLLGNHDDPLPCVCSIRECEGKLRIVGARLTANSEIQTFELSD